MARPVDVIVRRDLGTWVAWSPQCRGLTIVQPTPAHMREALPAALLEFLGPGGFDVRTHVEEEVRGAVVRVAQDDQLWERQHTAARIAAALGDPDLSSQMLAQPANSLGEVVFVCALPADTGAWVVRQLDGEGDTVNVVLPVADSMIAVEPYAQVADDRVKSMPDGAVEFDG